MFIHGFEGSWLQHPFWRGRFLLDQPEDLALLRASLVSGVLIDPARGLDVDAAPADPEPVAAEALPDPGASDPAETRLTIERAGLVSKAIYEDAREGRLIDARIAEPIVAEIAECVARNPAMFFDMARLKSKDEYTYLHSVSVCALMVNLARELELDEARVRALGLAGFLHDVGKMAVPAEVLNKPGRLDEAEFAAMRRHPEEGHAMLAGSPGITQDALDVCLLHHEKIDGTGYPYGLKDDAIGLAARMGAICDVYDALTSHRVYKEPWTPVRAVSEMDRWKGHFDEKLLFAFCRSLGIGPTGRLVRLRSGRLGVAVPDGTQGTRSKIRIFYSAETRRPVPLQDLFRGLGDRAVGVEDPADWGFRDWDAAVAKLIDGQQVMPDA